MCSYDSPYDYQENECYECEEKQNLLNAACSTVEMMLLEMAESKTLNIKKLIDHLEDLTGFLDARWPRDCNGKYKDINLKEIS